MCISQEKLFENTNTSRHIISEKLITLGYPFGYNFTDQKIVQTIQSGLVDSAKSVRAILWNSITIICTMIVSE